MTAKPLAKCTEADLTNGHALVFGRTRIWMKDLSDNNQFTWCWSATVWWKAMWYPHRGSPRYSDSWGVYGGSGSGGFTGPGDAELTHWLPMPPVPSKPEHNQQGAEK